MSRTVPSNLCESISKLDKYSSSEDEGPQQRKIFRKDVEQLEKEKELSGYEGDISSPSSHSKDSSSSDQSSSTSDSSSSSSSDSKDSKSSSSTSDESESSSCASCCSKTSCAPSSAPNDEDSSESTITYDYDKETAEEPRKITNQTFRDPYQYLR